MRRIGLAVVLAVSLIPGRLTVIYARHDSPGSDDVFLETWESAVSRRIWRLRPTGPRLSRIARTAPEEWTRTLHESRD
jgi:hypothetical protein